LRHALVPATGGKTKKNDDVGKCRPHSKCCYVDIRNFWRKTLPKIGSCGGVDPFQNEKRKRPVWEEPVVETPASPATTSERANECEE
jgi:hypothetical protein